MRLEPHNAPTLVILGVALLQHGRRQRGLQFLREALKVEPANAEAHYNLSVELRTENATEAEVHFRRAIELDPLYSIAHRELAYLLCQHGPTDEAEQHFARAVFLDATDPWTLVYWGTARWHALDGNGAQERFEAAIRVAPTFAVATWSLGNLLLDRGDTRAARQLYEAALRDDPTDEIAAKKLLSLSDKRERRSK